MEKVKVEKYFKRIGLEMPETIVPNGELLKKLHFAHCTTVPYENLDIIRGIPLRLDDEGLYHKVVEEGKGGYCFELNGLFAWLLRELGYKVTEYASRYLRGESSIPMRRHRVTIGHMEDGDYLCDIGVGQVAPRLPLKIEANAVQTQNGETYRFIKDEKHGRILQDLHKGEWRDYICFTDEEVFDVDFVQPSFFCEKHPSSPFNKTYMLAIKTENGRRTIDGRTYKEFAGEELIHIEENISDARLKSLLENEFKLTV
jgi:N-hydroxyarylamine O-acetyltransferase